MKFLLTLAFFSSGILLVNAQSSLPEKHVVEQKSTVVIQQEPVQKTNTDITVPKRIVQPAPSPEKKKVQKENTIEQVIIPADPNQPGKRVPTQVKEEQELQKKKAEYEQLKKAESKPE